MKWTRLLKAKEINIPNILYHATYRPLLRNIKKEGLVPGKRKNWDNDSQIYKNYVYLADDPYVAESHAESADLVKEEWTDDIVILQINTSLLNKEKIEEDHNNIGGDTFQYEGIIPSSAISVYNYEMD